MLITTCVKFESTDLPRLDRYAKLLGLTRSKVIRILMREWLNEVELFATLVDLERSMEDGSPLPDVEVPPMVAVTIAPDKAVKVICENLNKTA